MEAVKTWGTSICCAAVACAVLQLLAPRGGLGRLLEMLGALLLLCCTLSPLVTWDSGDWETLLAVPLSDTGQSELLQARVMEQLDEPLQQAVQEEGAAALSSYGLSAEKITAVMDTGEDGGIYITEIAVTLTPEQAVRRTAVVQILKERFGVEVEVTVEK